MNKIINIIFSDMKKDKNIYFSIMIVVLISLVFGALFITILKDSDITLVKEHINTYFDSIKVKEYIPSLYNNMMSNNITAIILWILGFSIVGLPLIICILFYKGFTLSFSVASLIYNFKIDGIFLSFIYIFPHLILNLLTYFIVTYYSFKLSVNLIGKILNKTNVSKTSIKKYLLILIISLIFLCLSAIYETYILPYLIKIIY